MEDVGFPWHATTTAIQDSTLGAGCRHVTDVFLIDKGLLWYPREVQLSTVCSRL
jgi:hypothetical protein